MNAATHIPSLVLAHDTASQDCGGVLKIQTSAVPRRSIPMKSTIYQAQRAAYTIDAAAICCCATNQHEPVKCGKVGPDYHVRIQTRGIDDCLVSSPLPLVEGGRTIDGKPSIKGNAFFQFNGFRRRRALDPHLVP